jgi:hypothetical protein
LCKFAEKKTIKHARRKHAQIVSISMMLVDQNICL